ncbi:DUF397 domain-containing protein [Streptomyces luteolifulvus]|uniref:DUF397 domain-containing protein n=1 Tax=Streptomyces luteolifulvus TaxID=2615112 RepID=A0A6H9UMU9_9ACTN|nr:DUF397 domain-containing protein [Streptomyces luteolifulvus]KAB1139190.1 DUF397 domain-containing protein [Streptomyces luteolifulvus]
MDVAIQAHRGEQGAEVVHKGEPLWRRSSMCGNENECLEVAVREGGMLARDSKTPDRSPVRFTASAWRAFLHAVTRGELSGS